MDDREQPLNDVARNIMTASNYDPHFSGIEERLIMETKLFLARLDALMDFRETVPIPALGSMEDARRASRSIPRMPDPIPMILFCHKCGVQHIDKAEDHKPGCHALGVIGAPCSCDRWTNPPHRSHLCAYCGHVWRPSDVPTTGVADIASQGSQDSPQRVRGVIDKTARFRPQWRHVARGTSYVELGRGELQVSDPKENELRRSLQDGDRMVAYQGEDNRVWFREESEFEDGRFEKL